MAGGDGFFGRRNRGIDSANGRMVDAQPRLQDCIRVSDGGYQRVEKLPFVDGVCIADTRVGQVQIDSAGHAFDGFPDSNPPIWRDDLQRQTIGASLSDCTPPVGLRYDGAAVGKVADASTDPLPGVTNHTKFGTVRPDPYSYVVLIGRNPAGTTGQLIKTKLDVYVPSACADLCVALQATTGNKTAFQVDLLGDKGHVWTRRPGWTGYSAGAFERNAWVPVEVVADYAAQTYTAAVGGVHWSGRFIEAATDQARIYLCCSSPPLTERAYFDHVIVESVPLAGFPVWAGGGSPAPAGGPARPVSAHLEGVDYGSPGHGALWLQANRGITFDLEAIRRANPGCKPVRFRAVAGCAETTASQEDSLLADIWVFVNGQLRFQRRRISRGNGVFPVLIPIGKSDRFVTLAATNGGDGSAWNWIIFGDPRLEVLTVPKFGTTETN